MKSFPLAALVVAVITAFSTGAIAQRHDSPGSSHGVARVSGSGVIKSIDAPGKKITLEHETINNFKMEAATHEFDVKSAATLGNLKAGDKVNFRLESSGRDLVVVQISKTASGAPSRATSVSVPEAQMQGSDQAKAAAEAKHLAKTHGTSSGAKQAEAQAAGSDQAKAAAEAKHLAKTHGTSGAAKQPEKQ
jgi:Cu/Ag efflux protein CusF